MIVVKKVTIKKATRRHRPLQLGVSAAVAAAATAVQPLKSTVSQQPLRYCSTDALHLGTLKKNFRQ